MAALFRSTPGVISALVLAVQLLGITAPFAAKADPGPASWQAVLTSTEATPPRMIAVDKSRQQLYLIERQGPLGPAKLYACTTGQVIGDKRVEGDLKTPEGVYFVVQRIGSGLDFVKYGNEAYTLNYPNPVDRLRRKTGYGIWIHGRGEGIYPLQTQGCVAMNNNDIALLGKLLVPGTPVALTSSFSGDPEQARQEAEDTRVLKKKVQDWSKAWAQRSETMFDFYDKSAYSIAQGEPFTKFQNQKERLFKSLPWIKSTITDIQVLQGPGYWVTWFYQDYEAPNLETSGVRRLYWAKDTKGDFKILGMEWAPGMSTGTLLASAEPATPPIESVPRSEEQAIPLPEALLASANILSPGVKPAVEPAAPSGDAAPAPNATASIPGTTPGAESKPSKQTTPAVTASAASDPAPVKRPTADHVESPAQGKMARPSEAAFALAQKMAAEKQAGGQPAQQKSTPAPAALALSLPPALPSQGLAVIEPVQNPPVQPSTPAGAVAQQPVEPQAKPVATANAGTPPVPVAPHAPTSAPAETATVPASALAANDTPTVSGKTAPAASAPANTPASGENLVAAAPQAAAQTAPTPEAVPPAAAKPSMVETVSSVTRLIEDWRKAWESGNVDAYADFYAPRALQGGRTSADSIRKHKKNLWAKAAPAEVILGDVRVVVQGAVVQADMYQEYTDSTGQGDKGIKTLTLENHNGTWLITQENWSPLPNETGN